MSLFFPEVFRLFPGSEGVSGGVLEDVFGIGEVTGGAFAGVRNNCSAAYKIVALLLLEYFYHSFGYGIGQRFGSAYQPRCGAVAGAARSALAWSAAGTSAGAGGTKHRRPAVGVFG